MICGVLFLACNADIRRDFEIYEVGVGNFFFVRLGESLLTTLPSVW